MDGAGKTGAGTSSRPPWRPTGPTDPSEGQPGTDAVRPVQGERRRPIVDQSRTRTVRGCGRLTVRPSLLPRWPCCGLASCRRCARPRCTSRPNVPTPAVWRPCTTKCTASRYTTPFHPSSQPPFSCNSSSSGLCNDRLEILLDFTGFYCFLWSFMGF